MPIVYEFNKPVSGAFTGSFSGLGSAITGVVSASYAGTDWNAINNKPSVVSGSAQVLADLSGSGIASQSSVNIFGSTTISGSLLVSGNANHSGYFVSASGFSGSGVNITGIVSASYATTASYASLAQNVLGSIASASFATTASYATVAQSVLGSISSASYATKAAFAPISVPFVTAPGADLFISAIPGATTEWDDGARMRLDLTNATQARLSGRIISGTLAGTVAFPQMSTDGELTWQSMSVIANGISVAFGPSTGTIAGTWNDLNPSAKGDFVIRWATSGGDGVTSVKLGSLTLHAR